jgi:hypothetical protein
MSRTPYPDIDIDQVRDHALRAVNRASLRSIAPTIPVGFTTLHNFLGGSVPHPRVRTALCEWYLRDRGGDGGSSAALDTLLEPFGEGEREGARRTLLDALVRAYADAGRPAPGWIGTANGGAKARPRERVGG